jgi:hypothetical protein
MTFVSWKGKSLNQITTTLQLNKNTNNNANNENIFRSGPIKLYRREIMTTTDKVGNPRTSLSIDEVNRPNGYFISQRKDCSNNGVVSYLNQKDTNRTNNLYENGIQICNTNTPSTTTINNSYISQEFNAKRRVRSAGMITRKYNPARNGDSYSTSNAQYLVSRSKTFHQNDYHFSRIENSSVCSSNSINHCQKYIISSSLGNNVFQYTWIDGGVNTVVIPNGSYNIDDFNAAFQTVMYNNKHYYKNNTNKKYFLLNFTCDPYTNQVVLQANVIPDNSYYSPAASWTQETYNPSGNISVVLEVEIALLYVPNMTSGNVIGLNSGFYPSTNKITYTQYQAGQSMQSQTFVSTNTPGLAATYNPVIYKPNNSQFAQQGGVSSSERIARLKYDTITTVGATYRSAYGSQVANELAYGVAPTDAAYTLKTALGYPMKCTPKFDKHTGNIIGKCIPTTFANMI